MICSLPLFPQVSQSWVQRYTGPGWLDNGGNDIAVDGSSNVYVTGTSHGGSETYFDYTTIKYNSDGEQEWIAIYSTPNNSSHDAAVGLAIDSDNNVYVTGTISNGENYDFATVKYNTSGNEQWVRIYNGPGNGHDYAAAIAVDNSGNCYVTGSSQGILGIGGESDYSTVKYNTDGDEQWVARYDGPPGLNALYGDEPRALEVSKSGDVYVTGFSENHDTTFSYATVKYNSSGLEQWANRYDDTENIFSKANSIALDNMGNIYVTGTSNSSITGDDYATIKYNSDGVEQWVRRYVGPDNYWQSEAVTVMSDNFGGIYVTGTTSGNGVFFATVKYNSTGDEQWISLYEAPNSLENYAVSMVVDAIGNIYVVGITISDGYQVDYATVKYNSSGFLKWEIFYDGPDHWEDQVKSVAVSGSGDVFVTGYSWGQRPGIDPGFDYATLKYAQSLQSTILTANAFTGSQVLEVTSTNGFSIGDNIIINPGGLTEEINKITGFGSILLQTPLQYDHNSGETIELLISTTVEDDHNLNASEYSLSQNYPNPFNPTTRIQYAIGSRQFVTLKVYDVLGNGVATLVDEFLPAGIYEVEFNIGTSRDLSLTSGIYFYRLQAGSFVETKKMLMLK